MNASLTSADCVQYIINVILPISDRGFPNARNPKDWKRINKYKVGSQTDMEGDETRYAGLRYGDCLDTSPQIRDAIVRIFELKGSDRDCFALFEKDGKIVDMDDLGD